METKGIDLTKCKNCWAIARARGIRGREYEITGWIKTLEEGTMLLVERDETTTLLWHNGEMDDHIIDLKIVPRDPETYKDWQVGDAIKNPDAVCYTGRVIFVSGDFVAIETNDRCVCYTRDELFNEGYRLILTDIEQQIIEEKKKYEPQDGDIVAWKDEEYGIKPAVSIYKESNRGYATIYANGLTEYSTYATFAMNIVRPATDEEKQKLFDAMAKEGKRWNAEKKVVEDIPKPHEFRKGEPVLVRSDRTHCWQLRAISLSVYGNPPKVEVTDGCDEWIYWIDKDEVIPYDERTMHLLGTTEDYEEGQPCEK